MTNNKLWPIEGVDDLLAVVIELRKQTAQLGAENKALRKLAHDYITAYEKLAFGDALPAANRRG